MAYHSMVSQFDLHVFIVLDPFFSLDGLRQLFIGRRMWLKFHGINNKGQIRIGLVSFTLLYKCTFELDDLLLLIAELNIVAPISMDIQ